jgi:hypothetical protein
VQNRNAVTFENLCEWAQINREWIHEYKVTGPCTLYKSELGEIGALAMELGIKRVTRLISEEFNDPGELLVSRNYSELWISHLSSSDRRIADNDSASAVDPAIGSARNVDCVDSLPPEELGSACASAAESTDHIDGPRSRNL